MRSSYWTGLLIVLTLSSSAFGETELQKQLAALESQQQELRQAWSTLTEQGSLAGRLGEIEAQLASLTAEERAELNKARSMKDLSPELSEKVAPALEGLTRVDGGLSSFQERYDAFNDAKIDYLLAKYQAVATEVMAGLEGQLKPAQKTALEGLLGEMGEHFRAHEEVRADPKSGKNRQRLYPSRSFMKAFQKFADEARRSQLSWPARAKEKVAGVMGKLKLASALTLAPPAIRAYSTLRNQKPIGPAFQGLAQAVQNKQGYSHDIVGREHITVPTPQEGAKVVNVYAASHMNALLDAVSLGQLQIPKSAIFTTDDTWKRAGLSKQIDAHPEFILVSQGKNPLVKIGEQYEAGNLRNIIIHPEGNQPSGVAFEVRKPNENFARGTLGLLRRKGYQINLIPVTTPTHFRVLNQPYPGEGDSKALTAQVHAPISGALVDLALASGDAEVLSRLIRGHWLESLNEYGPKDRFLGMPELAENERIVDQALMPAKGCREFIGALSGH